MNAARSAGAARPTQQRKVRERIVPGWLARTALILCVLGLLVSAYLTIEAFTAGATLACP